MSPTISAKENSPSRQITNIQALRGIAALLVFVAHIVGAERDYGGGEQLLPAFLRMGESGVDLFFLISGFIMVYVTAPKNADPNHNNGHGINASLGFFYRRATRIYPLYWVLTVGLIVLYAGKKILFGEDTPIDNYIASFFLLPDDQFPIIPVGWTLVHEMYFYLIFSVMLLFHRKFLPLLLAGWGILVLLGWLCGLRELNPWFAVITSPLTFEFLLGAVIAFLAMRGIRPYPGSMTLIAVGILLILFILFADYFYPIWFAEHARRMLLFSLPFGLLLYGVIGLEWNTDRVAPRWLVRLGDASYSLYLIHIPMFLVVGKLINLLAGPGILDNIILIFIYLLSGITAALLVHKYIEQPLIKIAKTRSSTLKE